MNVLFSVCATITQASSEERGPQARVWDHWGWDAATEQQPQGEDTHTSPVTTTLPPGEKPDDLRKDPFFKMKAQEFLNRQGDTEQPNSGRNTKSGLVRTATDVVKYIIPWPHHVVY